MNFECDECSHLKCDRCWVCEGFWAQIKKCHFYGINEFCYGQEKGIIFSKTAENCLKLSTIKRSFIEFYYVAMHSNDPFLLSPWHTKILYKLFYNPFIHSNSRRNVFWIIAPHNLCCISNLSPVPGTHYLLKS